MDRRAFLQFARSAADEDVPSFPPALRRLKPRRAPKYPRSAAKTAAAVPRLGLDVGLEPYDAPLDRRRAAHLLRRVRFGARPADLDRLVGLDADAAVELLLDEALGEPLPPRPEWADAVVPPPRDDRAAFEQYIRDNNAWMEEFRTEIYRRMYQGSFRERMMLFWSNHFVTEVDGYFNLAVYAYRYVDTLREHALGNFRDFVHAIGLNPAMLYYLNGTENRVGAPNENYARELCELFTMTQRDREGNDNYSQTDIEEIARALTGWVADPFRLVVEFVPVFHDHGQKTIFGERSDFDYDGVIELIFARRASATAYAIAGALCRDFIHPGVDDALIVEVAGVMEAEDFEILPVLRTILQSAYFNDDQVIGAQIKSPVTFLTGLAQETFFEDPPDPVFLLFDRINAFFLEQRILDPPNVAGWNGHHTWLSTTTLPARWLVSTFLVYGGRGNDRPIDLVPLAEYLLGSLDEPMDPSDPKSVFYLAEAMATHLMPVPLETLDLNPPDGGFAGDLTTFPLPDEIADGPQYVRDLAMLFLASVPWYDWNLYLPEAPLLLLNFARTLGETPEFQLT